MIVGDINIDILKYNLASNVTEYMNNLNSVGCTICIDKPTRVTSHGSSCIDHVYSNFCPEKLDTTVLLSDITDHFSTLTKIQDISKEVDHQDIFIRKSNLNPNEWDDFNSQLYSELKSYLPNVTQPYDVNSCAVKITETYQKVINDFMPLHKVSRKQNKLPSKPWITKGLRISSDRKDLLYHKAISTKSLSDWEFYKKYRNIFCIVEKRMIYVMQSKKILEK